jgi:hypothetical protein
MHKSETAIKPYSQAWALEVHMGAFSCQRVVVGCIGMKNGFGNTAKNYTLMSLWWKISLTN